MIRSPQLKVNPPLPVEEAAELPLAALDVVWIQLTGTLCNIACRHCFITCGPQEERVRMLGRDEVRRVLDECRRLGVQELYFTGGEPMMHPDFFGVIEDSLAVAPTSFLTNGILIDAAAAARLRALSDGARYSLDVRVSLDGMTAAKNDPVRGRGTFAAIVRALGELGRAGLLPVVTVVEHADGMASADRRGAFLHFLRGIGLPRPWVKFLPLLRIGREARRTRGYRAGDYVRAGTLDAQAAEALQCARCRLVTADGVWTCPLLLDEPEARVAADLASARGPIRLRWSACTTCVTDGLTCRT